MSQTVSVALIGGGRTGSPLLRELLKHDYIRVLGVADLSANSPGMVMAGERNIPCFSDPMEMVKAVREVDLLIEVSGDPDLKGVIKQYFEASGNRHTIILHDIVVRLIVSLTTGSPILMPSQHPDDDGIG